MSHSSIKDPSAVTKTRSVQIATKPSPHSRLEQVDLANPGFGAAFSDHMFSMEYKNGSWGTPEIIPFKDFSCSPAMATLHYGQTVFEGMKVFRTPDNTVQAFRPRDHFERFNQSCRRLCIPKLDIDLMLKALEQLVSLDQKWVPAKQGNALYIRPLVFATDNYLGVRPSQSYQLFILTSPVGAYYKEGFDPVSLTTDTEFVRAVQGGSGNAKTACNYGPTLLPAKKAKEEGFTQVLWLDAHEHRYIEEVGTMNIFFKIDGTLVTPPLNGTILGGITRDSVIHLAKEWGIEVEERPITIDEVFQTHSNGSLEEVFGTGTAAVISPVGKIHHDGNVLITDEQQIGPFAKKMYDTVTDIQYGRKSDEYDWIYPLC